MVPTDCDACSAIHLLLLDSVSIGASTSPEQEAHCAADESDGQQSDEGLLFDGSGDGRRSATHPVSSLAISMLCRGGCVARQSLRFGLRISSKGTDGSPCSVRKPRGMVFDIGLIHRIVLRLNGHLTMFGNTSVVLRLPQRSVPTICATQAMPGQLDPNTL
jgi:hypothetical protein